MLKYSVIAHKKVLKFLSELKDETVKNSFKEHIAKLQDYPLSLREMDTEKVKGEKNTFRLRIGKFRVVFFVDNAEGTVYVVNIEARKKVYSKKG